MNRTGKVSNVPPQLPKELISKDTEVIIENAKVVHDQDTQLGHINVGLGLEVKIRGQPDIYSYIFGCDRKNITGSAGRILSRAGITDTEASDFEARVAKLKGAMFHVSNNAGKLYWR